MERERRREAKSKAIIFIKMIVTKTHGDYMYSNGRQQECEGRKEAARKTTKPSKKGDTMTLLIIFLSFPPSLSLHLFMFLWKLVLLFLFFFFS
jgi:hypothetical protein